MLKENLGMWLASVLYGVALILILSPLELNEFLSLGIFFISSIGFYLVFKHTIKE